MLILKQNAANTVPTPPAGKGTIFLDDSDTLSVKTSDGNVETFPTVGASNAQVVFMNGTSLSGESDFTYDFNTNVLNVTGNVAAGNLLTNNLLYANGTPWDLQEAAGSNNQIQYNTNNNFAASANFTYNDSTQLLTVSGNAQFNNANLGNLATANFALLGTNSTAADFPNAISITSKNNTGVQATDNFGLVGEATGDSGNTSTTGVGVFGIGKANGDTKGTGVQGFATVTNSGDTGAAVGVRGYATTTHSGGYNIGVLGNASGSGFGNYAFYVQAGNIASIETNTAWDLNDDSATALAFNSSGKANILAISTVNDAEGVSMSGTLSVTGNVTVPNLTVNLAISGNTANFTGNIVAADANLGNLATANFVNVSTNVNVTGTMQAGNVRTDNLLYANGTAWDLQEAAGSNNQIQFNISNNFAASANFTYNDTTQLFTVLGNAQFNNANAGNLLTANFVAGTLTTASQPNVTSLGTLSGLDVNGNITAANITANTGVFTGNGSGLSALAGGNVTGTVANATHSSTANTVVDAAQANITSLGTLTGLGVNGNITAANITANTGVFTGNGIGLSALAGANVTGQVGNALVAGTVYTNAQPNITSVGTLTSLAVTGNLSAGNISTGGALSVTGNANVGNLGATDVTATTLGGTLTTASQPNITSVGTLSSLTITGNASAGNLSTGGVLSVTGNANVGNLGTAGLIVATGNITGGNLTTAGALSVTGNANVGNIGAAAGVFTTVDGTLTTASQPNVTSVGTLSSLAVTGNGTFGNVYANSGTVGAANLTGTLTTNAQPNITSVGTLTGLGVNGNITAANITANTGVFTGNGSGLSQLAGGNVTGQVANALVASTVYTNAQPNITSVGTLTSLSVTGNVAAGNLTTTGILSVTGTGTSSIAGNLDMTSNTISNLATPTSANDAATKQYVDDLASTALVYHEGVTAATTGTLASATGGTITYDNGTSGVGATLTTTGTFNLIDTANVQVVGTRILVKDEANAAHNGVYTYTSTTVITRATDADSYGPGADELSLNNYFFVSGGDVNKGSAYVVDSPSGTITFGTSNILFAQFSSSQVYAAGTGLTLTGTTFSVNASQTQITSVGTLTGLSVNGNITAANITANTGVFTGNGSGLSALAGGNVTGQVANALVAGTVYTAAQPNITSVGTLTSLGVNGTVTAVAFTANTGVFTGNGSGLSALAGGNVTGQVANALVAGTVYTAAQPNITSVGTLTSLAVTGNASAGNISTGGALSATGNANVGNIGATNGVFTSVSGNGSALTALNASNISTGTLAQARLANSNVILGSTTLALGTTTTTIAGLSSVTSTTFVGALTGAATTAGTVTTAAQANITSVGTLTGLGVNGNITAANITANTGVFTGNGSGLSAIAGANVTGTVSSATTAGTVTTAAQPNITSVGTLSSLNVTGNANVGNIGAAAGVFTSVSGNGAALTALNASNISTGTLAQARLANSNVTLGSTALTLGSTVTTVAGLSSVTSTTFVGALTGAATTAGTVTTAAQPNITSVGTLTSLSSSGNITAPNLIANTGMFISSVNAAVSAAGTVQANATALTTQINVTSTVASGAGVRLPTAVAGMRVTIINTAANAVLVYPATSGIINSQSANVAYSLPAAGKLDFVAVSTTQWYTLNATYA